jgi:hypothetical protein
MNCLDNDMEKNNEEFKNSNNSDNVGNQGK